MVEGGLVIKKCRKCYAGRSEIDWSKMVENDSKIFC